MGRNLVTGVLVVWLLMACTEASEPPTRKPQQAGKPLSSADVVVRMVATEAAVIAGDQQAVQANVEAFADDIRRSIKLADPARSVDRESARLAARRVDGVRSVAWIDRENLFVIVSRNDARNYDTIDAICLQLEPLGDTLGVVVNLQSGAAVNGDDLEILSRNCQLAPGDRAFLQQPRQVDVISSTVRAQHRANNPQQATQDMTEWKRRNAESMRAIEATTPEM